MGIALAPAEVTAGLERLHDVCREYAAYVYGQREKQRRG